MTITYGNLNDKVPDKATLLPEGVLQLASYLTRSTCYLTNAILLSDKAKIWPGYLIPDKATLPPVNLPWYLTKSFMIPDKVTMIPDKAPSMAWKANRCPTRPLC